MYNMYVSYTINACMKDNVIIIQNKWQNSCIIYKMVLSWSFVKTPLVEIIFNITRYSFVEKMLISIISF